ncbi:hypothetical protein BH24GEM3_BH24GEM3_06910 [soil metagenome]
MSAPTTDGRLRIVVGGFLGLLPAGGVTWDYVQYPLGFFEMGHDVFYIEDTRLWPVYQTDNEGGYSCAANVAHLAAVMEFFGMQERWAYRDEASGECFGLPLSQVEEICRTADLFVNVSCSTFLRDEYLRIPARVLIDSDPMFSQIQYAIQEAFTPGASGMRGVVAGHTHHFTFGENIGAADCRIPLCGVDWKPTRQPVCLEHWPVTPLPRSSAAAFTTLMNWTAARQLVYKEESWGQKDTEFLRILDLPRSVPRLPLAVAVGQTGNTEGAFPREEAERRGWQVLDPNVCAPDWMRYRDFIQDSRGEFSIAKETYVKGRTGWFSCRSACYLAAARPVITQETGWSRYVPGGSGLLAFEDFDGAVAALERVASDPAAHALAAREIAQEYFRSDRILGELLAQVSA